MLLFLAIWAIERSLFVTPPDGILAAKLALNGKPLLKYWFFINIEYGENPRRTFHVFNRFFTSSSYYCPISGIHASYHLYDFPLKRQLRSENFNPEISRNSAHS